jgi:hypothetical protein
VNSTFLVSDFKKLKVGKIPTFIGKQQLYKEYYIHDTGKFLLTCKNWYLTMILRRGYVNSVDEIVST